MFQPTYTFDPRLISYIFGHPDDFKFGFPTQHKIPKEKVPGTNYTIYYPFLLRFIEEVENVYPLYPYQKLPKSEYQLLFPELYGIKPWKSEITPFYPGTNPYHIIHDKNGLRKYHKWHKHTYHKKVKNTHRKPGEPSYEIKTWECYSDEDTSSNESVPTTYPTITIPVETTRHPSTYSTSNTETTQTTKKTEKTTPKPETEITYTPSHGTTDGIHATTPNEPITETIPPKSQDITNPATGTEFTLTPGTGETGTIPVTSLGTTQGAPTPPKGSSTPRKETEFTLTPGTGATGTMPVISIGTPGDKSCTTYDFRVKIKHHPNGEEYLILYIPGTNFNKQYDTSFDNLKSYLKQHYGEEPDTKKLPNGEIQMYICVKGLVVTGTTPSSTAGTSVQGTTRPIISKPTTAQPTPGTGTEFTLTPGTGSTSGTGTEFTLTPGTGSTSRTGTSFTLTPGTGSTSRTGTSFTLTPGTGSTLPTGTEFTLTPGTGETGTIPVTSLGTTQGAPTPPKGSSTPRKETEFTLTPGTGATGTMPVISIGTPGDKSCTTYDFRVKIKHHSNGEEYLILYIPGTNFNKRYDISFDELISYLKQYYDTEPDLKKLPNGDIQMYICVIGNLVTGTTAIFSTGTPGEFSTPSTTYDFCVKIRNHPNGTEYLIIYDPGTDSYKKFDKSFDDFKQYLIEFTGLEPKVTKFPNGEIIISIYTPKGFKFTLLPGSITTAADIAEIQQEGAITPDTFEFRVKTGYYSDGEEYIIIYIPGTDIYKQFSISFDDFIQFLIEFNGQKPKIIKLPNGDMRIIIYRKRIPMFVRGPNGEIIRIVQELPGFTPGIVTDSNKDIIQFLVPISNRTLTVPGPQGQNIELIPGNSQNTPGVVTNDEGYIIQVILPDFFSRNKTTQEFTPVTVQGPHGEQILIEREHPGVTPGMIMRDGRILRIIVPKFSGEIPTYITGPNGEIVHIIPGHNDTTPGVVTRPGGQLLYILLPQGFFSSSSIEGLVGPNVGLINPGTTSNPSAQIGNRTKYADVEFPNFNGTETHGTKGAGVNLTGDSGQFGSIPQNYSTLPPIFLFNTNFEKEELPQNYSLPPKYRNITVEWFGDPDYNNTSLTQFDNIFSALLKNGSPRIKQIMQVIVKARGTSPKSFNLRIFVEELSRILADMRNDNEYFNYSELFIELMFETLMAALEIIRNAAAFCIHHVSIDFLPPAYIANYINALFDILI